MMKLNLFKLVEILYVNVGSPCQRGCIAFQPVFPYKHNKLLLTVTPQLLTQMN